MRLIKSRLFWVVIAFFVTASILHYSELIGIPGTVYPSLHFGLTRHSLDRILFFISIIHATLLFRRKGAFITAFSALAVMLPRAILISPSLMDALAETIAIIAISLTAAWGIWGRAEARDRTEAALVKLESAHKMLQQYFQSAQKNERRQTILNTISRILGESVELESILRKAIHLVSELAEVDAALIFSLDEERPQLKLVAYEGVSDDFARAVDGVTVGQGIYGEVARTCQPLVVDANPDDPRFTLPEVSKMGIQSQLIVPMMLKNRIRGVLCIAMRRPREFSVEDMELLMAVGTQIATAIENALLYEKERLVAQQLAVSERNYRRLFENASDAIWVHDLEGNITTANEAASRLFGYAIEELRKMNVRSFLSEESFALTGQIRRRLLEKEPVEQPYEQRLLKKDGTEAILKVSTSVVSENRRPVGLQHIARDVTEEKRAEEMLTKIIDASPIPIFVVNREHRVTHWNRALETLSGIRKEEIIGKDEQWRAFYPEKRPAMADLIVDGASADVVELYYYGKYKRSSLIEGAYEAEDFFPAIGEGGKWLHFTASPIKDSSGETIGAIETLRDVTEQRRMEDSLRYYLSQITKVQEEERKRIARELHDDTSQALFALSRQLDNFARSNTRLTTETVTFLKDLRQQVNGTLEGIRRFTQELRPPMLDDLGLLATLRWEVSELEKRSGTKAGLIVKGSERRFSTETELIIFRIVQEALRNVEKHARASKVEVEIEFGKGKTVISVADNGKGFDVGESLAVLPRTGRLGLAGMEERVHLLNGRIKVESTLGKGTRVTVELPL